MNKLLVLLKDCLHDHEAVIAGGFLTCLYLSKEQQDIDMYVSIDKLVDDKDVSIIDKLVEAGYDIVKCHMAPMYDQSFLQKNNIVTRFRFYPQQQNDGIRKKDIDLMIVGNPKGLVHITMNSPDNVSSSISMQKNVYDVVTNFDLTCCEMWYNGDYIMTKKGNVERMNNMIAYLNDEYVESLIIHSNTFIKDRLAKYMRRGFNISFKIPQSMYNDHGTIDYTKQTKSLHPDNKTNWLISKIMDCMFVKFTTNIANVSTYVRTLCKFGLSKETLYGILHQILDSSEDELMQNYDMDALNYHELTHGIADKYYTPMFILNEMMYYELKNELYWEALAENFNINESLMGLFVLYKDAIYKANCVTYNKIDARELYGYKAVCPFKNIDAKEVDLSSFKKSFFDVILFSEMDDDEIERTVKFIALDEDKKPVLDTNGDLEVVCIDKADLYSYLKDRDSWHFECPIGENGRAQQPQDDQPESKLPYVKLPLDKTGLNFFVDIREVFSLLVNEDKWYGYSYTGKDFTFSGSWKALYSRNPNWVSANHCQMGSKILTYTLTQLIDTPVAGGSKKNKNAPIIKKTKKTMKPNKN
jgi:hypothetical protein